jgi:nucleotide-binding universal stress UspA family protein
VTEWRPAVVRRSEHRAGSAALQRSRTWYTRAGSLAGVPVEFRALGGLPGHILVDQSRDADLLVVGHRGRGGFRSAVLGSVGLQCVLYASVPVTVVRAAQQPVAV